MFSRVFRLFRPILVFTLLAVFFNTGALYSQGHYEKLLKSFSDEINRTSFDKLNVLNASWEGGDVVLINEQGEQRKVKISGAGGMAVVACELPPAMVEYGEKRGIKIHVNSVHPYIEEAVEWGGLKDEDRKKGPLNLLIEDGFLKPFGPELMATYDGEDIFTEVFVGKTSFGNVYLLRSKAWTEIFGDGKNPYVMTRYGEIENETKLGDTEKHDGLITLAEERAHVIIGQNVAQLYDILNSNSGFFHDYHLSLALFYNEKINPVIIGHNAAYQGLTGFNYNKVEYWAHEQALDNLASRFNVSRKVIHEYFRIWATHSDIGKANLLQAVLRKARQLTGISMTAVSPPQAELIGKTLAQLEAEIRARYPNLPADHFAPDNIRKRFKAFYRKYLDTQLDDAQASRFVLQEESRGVPEVREANVVPVLNGLARDKHASVNSTLKQVVQDPYLFKWRNPKTIDYIKNVIAADPEFSQGLNFNWDNTERMLKAKRYIRRLMLMEFFPDQERLWDNTTSYIRYGWGRLTEQKFWELGIAEVDHLTKNGDIVIFLAPIPDNSPDHFYKEIGRKTREKAQKMQEQGLWFSFVTDFNSLGAFFSAGADDNNFFSLREPCGLVDKEGMGYGTTFNTHRVGGLGYGAEHVGFFFDGDLTDPDALRRAYRAAAIKARFMWENDKKAWLQRQVDALKMNYTYEIPANTYIDLAFESMLKSAMNKAVEISEAYRKDLVSDDIYQRMLSEMNRVPEFVRKAFLEYGKQFSSYEANKAFFYGASNEALEAVFDTKGGEAPLPDVTGGDDKGPKGPSEKGPEIVTLPKDATEITETNVTQEVVVSKDKKPEKLNVAENPKRGRMLQVYLNNKYGYWKDGVTVDVYEFETKTAFVAGLVSEKGVTLILKAKSGEMSVSFADMPVELRDALLAEGRKRKRPVDILNIDNKLNSSNRLVNNVDFRNNFTQSTVVVSMMNDHEWWEVEEILWNSIPLEDSDRFLCRGGDLYAAYAKYVSHRDSRSSLLAYIGEASGSDTYILLKTFEKLDEELDANNGRLTLESLSIMADETVLDYMISIAKYPSNFAIFKDKPVGVLTVFKDLLALKDGGYDRSYYLKPEMETFRRELREFNRGLKK